jgi:acyl dehydratase
VSDSLRFDDLREGQELPPFVRTTDLMNWNRFAAVYDEFVDFHMDDEAARRRGEKGAIGMGNLRFSYLHSLLRAWLGEAGEIRRLACQHRGINYKGDTLTCHGRVVGTRVANGERLVELELWVENQRGERIDTGSATVVLFEGVRATEALLAG